mgnify:CR=1 FL=1|tara:strand:+ start:723 stop:1139 length:417 start_codon:yes stop_codon:yes gene_type:complete
MNKEHDMEDLNVMTELLLGDGEPMPGGDLTLDEAIALGQSEAKKKPFRVVRNWIWADLAVSETEAKTMNEQGFQPVMVYAEDVMYDSSYKFDIGFWVRTSPLKHFTPPCIFETANTTYILVGEGKRKTTSVNAIMRIF